MRRQARTRLLAGLALVVAGAGAGALFGFLYLRSDAFAARLRGYVVEQIAQSTRTTVTLGGFHFSFSPLELDLDDLVLHGREQAGQRPLASVAHLHLRLRVVSLAALLRRQILLESALAQQPDVNVYLLPDGASNLPALPVSAPSGRTQAQALLAIGIHTLELEQGALRIEDRTLPLQVTLRDFGLRLSAQAGSANYEGELHYGSAEVDYGKWRPLHPAAEARFVLAGNDLQLEQCVISAAGARISLSGVVRHFTQPEFNGSYVLDANLAQWLEVLRVKALTAGRLHAQGPAFWSSTGWSATGTLGATGLRFAGVEDGAVWRASGSFGATPAGLTLPRLTLAGAGAVVNVHGGYGDWNALDLDGQVAGLRLGTLAPFLATAGLDARAVAPMEIASAAVAGSFHLRGSGALNDRSHDHLEMNVRWTPLAEAGKIPVSGEFQGAFSNAPRGGGTLAVASFDAALAASHLSAQGNLDGERSHLEVELTTAEAAELRPFVPLARKWPEWGGAGSIKGALTGSLDAPEFNGEAAFTHARLGDYAADEVRVTGALGPSQLLVASASVRAAAQQINASGRVGLTDYQLTPASALQARISAANLDLSRLQTVAGMHYPIHGSASLRLTVGGTRAHPSGSGEVRIARAGWEAQAVDAISADFQLANDALTTNNLVVVLTRTRVSGQLRAGLDDKSYALDLSSPSLQLGDIAWLQSSRLAVGGSAQFHLTGRGVWTAPQADLTVTTANLRGGGESLGDIHAQLHLANGNVSFNATDTLTNGSLALNGNAGIESPYPAQARLELRDYDFDAWLRRFTPAELSGHSNVSGVATLAGPLADPAGLTAHIALDPIEVAVSGVGLHNQGPVAFDIGQQQLRLEPAHIVGTGNDFTDFTLSGSAALAPLTAGAGSASTMKAAFAGPLQAVVQGRVNLALLHSLSPPTRAGGQLVVAARVGGSLAQPQLNGTIEVHGGTLTEDNFPIGFDSIEGKLRLAGTRAQIEQLNAHTGGGTVSVSGFAGHTSAGWNFDLNAMGQALRVRYQGISATGDAQLRFSGQRNTATLSGNAVLNRIALANDFDLAIFIATTQTDDAPTAADSLLNRVRLDVHLVTGPQVELATNLAHLQLQGDLRLRGTLADPVVLGRASASEGRILFAGNSYQVDKAQVQFVNPFRIEPVLDVGLSTTVQQYDVTLNISGPVDKLRINYRSDPPLGNSDIVALLATGAPTQASAALNQSATNSFAGQSEQLLGAALDNVVAGRLQRLFGITQVQVNPNSGIVGATGSGSTVTLAQQVSRDLKLTYTQNLSSSAQDIVQIDWTINRKLGVTLSRDQFGLYGLKFTFRQRVR